MTVVASCVGVARCTTKRDVFFLLLDTLCVEGLSLLLWRRLFSCAQKSIDVIACGWFRSELCSKLIKARDDETMYGNI
jgi:hypothetical protein